MQETFKDRKCENAEKLNKEKKKLAPKEEKLYHFGCIPSLS